MALGEYSRGVLQLQYVQQHDNLIPILTVQQTFECLAMFYTTDKQVVKARAEQAIQMLGLEAQRNTIIGTAHGLFERCSRF